MKVFVQNEAGSFVKHYHNEKTLEFLRTARVSRAYPLPYGFVLDTTAADGMNVDCFVLTARPLKSGMIVECDPVGLMEQFENGPEDHNLLAVFPGEQAIVDEAIQRTLSDFVEHVFDHIPEKQNRTGNFYGREEAIAYLLRHLDRGAARAAAPQHS